MLSAADNRGRWNPAEVLKQRFPAPASTSYTVTNVNPATGEQRGGLIAIAEGYPESDVVRWMQSGKLLYEGNPFGDDHVDGIAGRDDGAYKLACHYEGKGESFEYALATGQLIINALTQPAYGSTQKDRDFGRSWTAKLEYVYSKFRGPDRSAWGRIVRGNEQQQTVEVSDDECSEAITLGDFLRQQGTKQDPILFNLERGMLGVLYGPSNAGKTTVKLEMVFHAISGKDFHGWTVDRGNAKPLRVLYVEKEDHIDNTRRKLRRMLGGKYNVADKGEPENFVEYVGNYDEHERKLIEDNFILLPDPYIAEDPATLSNPAHVKWLIRQAKRYKVDLIIIDTYKASFDVDENDNTLVGRLVVNPMRRVISETHCAVVLIHHTGTDDGRMRGATALEGAARWVVRVTPVTEPDLMRPGKYRRISTHFRLEDEKRKGVQKADTFHRVNNEGYSLKVDEPNHPIVIALANGETFKEATTSPEAQKAKRTREQWHAEVRIALLDRDRTKTGEWVSAPTLAREMGAGLSPKPVRQALVALADADAIEKREMAHAGEFEYRVRPIPQED